MPSDVRQWRLRHSTRIIDSAHRFLDVASGGKATYHAIGGGVDDRQPDNKSRMSLGSLWRRLHPQTRFVILLSFAGALIYGVIGAVTLRWYWGLFLALWALVLGSTFTLIKRLRREKHPRRE